MRACMVVCGMFDARVNTEAVSKVLIQPVLYLPVNYLTLAAVLFLVLSQASATGSDGVDDLSAAVSRTAL